MEKLKLQIEDLVVASFETEPASELRGTVAGYEEISGANPLCGTGFTQKTCLTNITCCTPMV